MQFTIIAQFCFNDIQKYVSFGIIQKKCFNKMKWRPFSIRLRTFKVSLLFSSRGTRGQAALAKNKSFFPNGFVEFNKKRPLFEIRVELPYALLDETNQF